MLHFAGLKAVGESVAQLLHYYDNNVHGSQVLLQAMADAGVFSFVFSSLVTVYGDLAQMPISEDPPVGQPTDPYGRRKRMVELTELAAFGNDSPTHDGTSMRDYIHWVDLAEGCIRALDALETRTGAHVWNLGTGQG